MLKVKKSLLVLSVLLLMARNAATQLAQVTQIPISTQTLLAVVNTPLLDTATVAPTATETPTQSPTDTTVAVATEPPLTATAASLINSYSATMAGLMGSEGSPGKYWAVFQPGRHPGSKLA